MISIIISILVVYIFLLSITRFLDPKGKGSMALRGLSVYHMIIFSTVKMLIVIAPVIVVVIFIKFPLNSALGLSGFSLSWSGFRQGLLAALGFALLHIIWQFITSHLPRSSSREQKKEDSERIITSKLPGRWIPLIVTFFVISLEAGLLEELFFRGIAQTNFSNFLSPIWGVMIPALLFGFAHFYQGIWGIVETFLLGVLLGIAFATTGNLAVPILGHFLGDFACMMLSARQIISSKREDAGRKLQS